jgi:type IV secretion system protein VirB9
MMRRLCILAGLALLAAPLHAEITPHAGEGDPHIQSVEYDPQQVVGLHVAGGYAVTLVFAPDERIETVTLGDSAGWQVTVDHRADHLVVKPLGNPPPTNLTVMSDQRSYNFTLYGAGPGEGVQPYLVSFTYPVPPAEPVLAQTAPAPGTYKLRGDRTIWPATMSDDGVATAIRWAGEQTIPAVYEQDERGQLALVNGLMEGGIYRIEGVHSRLVFVLGKARATASRVARQP